MIPASTRDALRARLQRHVAAKWKGRCREVIVRFRGAYAYVDALPPPRPHPPGTPREQRAIVDATPIRLCRLGYFGNRDRWAYAFFKYSDEKYEPSFLPSGGFVATPEEAFDCSATVYLQD